MNIQITKWGSIQPVYAHSGKILSEIVTFHSKGMPHKHKDFELCTVLGGQGKIITEKAGIPSSRKEYDVFQGSFLAIPPDTVHWMEPNFSHGKELVILIAYTNNYQHDD